MYRKYMYMYTDVTNYTFLTKVILAIMKSAIF